ncbi:hypothetical protein B0H12DRAFT_1074689 [Mycena haematopus]|nr:hypothetical protein B0H12DRAFT_1074689 [Mycena haematopus]
MTNDTGLQPKDLRGVTTVEYDMGVQALSNTRNLLYGGRNARREDQPKEQCIAMILPYCRTVFSTSAGQNMIRIRKFRIIFYPYHIRQTDRVCPDFNHSFVKISTDAASEVIDDPEPDNICLRFELSAAMQQLDPLKDDESIASKRLKVTIAGRNLTKGGNQDIYHMPLHAGATFAQFRNNLSCHNTFVEDRQSAQRCAHFQAAFKQRCGDVWHLK